MANVYNMKHKFGSRRQCFGSTENDTQHTHVDFGIKNLKVVRKVAKHKAFATASSKKANAA